MVLVPWSLFWVSTEEFDWQMKIPVTMMLAMVAFEYSISWDLPRISYITFLDAVFLTSFAFTFLTTVEITAVHVLIMRDKLHVAEKIQRSSRWLFPLAYLLVLLILVLLFLVAAAAPNERGRPSLRGRADARLRAGRVKTRWLPKTLRTFAIATRQSAGATISNATHAPINQRCPRIAAL
jgi:hypothetical protein